MSFQEFELWKGQSIPGHIEWQLGLNFVKHDGIGGGLEEHSCNQGLQY
jgi:hypothetical protein